MTQAELLQWIDAQADAMAQWVWELAEINSGTYHLAGVERVAQRVIDAFAPLGCTAERVPLPPERSMDGRGELIELPLAPALRFVKRPQAERRALLCIHLDTVYPPEHPFQQVTRIDADTLRGPGVVDAKGGLVVLLTALRAFEQSDAAAALGWEVILNTDEEIGSPGSAGLLLEAARRNHAGLVFEPALPDGSLVGARKGSGNFTVVVRGVAAHAGRDFSAGRSAIVALARLVEHLDRLNGARPGVIVNCGRIEGGGALNIVPDLAIGRFNGRAGTIEEQHFVESAFTGLSSRLDLASGVHLTVHGGFHSPPKPLDPRCQQLTAEVQAAGRALGLELAVHPSGGTCDGNRLAAAGLPTVDSLGPCGGDLHSASEFLSLSSLTQRATLCAMTLMRLADNAAGIFGTPRSRPND
jgi:glutamate carboxypeptidase